MCNASRLGRENISSAQQQLLESANSQCGSSVSVYIESAGIATSLAALKKFILNGWRCWMFSERMFASQVPSEIYKRIENFFENLLPIDKSIKDLHPERLNRCFCLAPESKPAPSDIPRSRSFFLSFLNVHAD
jgi:hypothetical protein